MKKFKFTLERFGYVQISFYLENEVDCIKEYCGNQGVKILKIEEVIPEVK